MKSSRKVIYISSYRRSINLIPPSPPVKVDIVLLLFLARLLPLITGFDRNHAPEASASRFSPHLIFFGGA